MTKEYELQNLCCPKCATDIEAGIAKIKEVNHSSLNFFTQKLTIEADEENFPRVIKSTLKLIKRIEPDVKLKEI